MTNLATSFTELFLHSQVVVRIMDQKRRRKGGGGGESEDMTGEYYDDVFIPALWEKKQGR